MTTQHIIDCSAQPIAPDDWLIKPEDQIASRFQGELVWDPERIRLYLDPVQEIGDAPRGEELVKRFEGLPVLPANVLNYLLEHPALIPSAWKGKIIFFWGTIYDCWLGTGVRYLAWNGRSWASGNMMLLSVWSARHQAVVQAR